MSIVRTRVGRKEFERLRNLVPECSSTHDPFKGIDEKAVSCRGAALITHALNSSFLIVRHEWSSTRCLVGEDERHFFTISGGIIIHTTLYKGPSRIKARDYFSDRDQEGITGREVSKISSIGSSTNRALELESVDREGDLVFSRLTVLDPILFLEEHTNSGTMNDLTDLAMR
jgi:hypothetical protein